MRKHSHEKIRRLVALRKEGYSIDQLMQAVKLPKTTVWHHIHNIKISEDLKKIIRSRQGGSKDRREKNLRIALQKAEAVLKSPKRELALVTAMLYWAEGSKGDCEFINSDGRMIKLYLYVVRNVFNVPEEFLLPTMRIFGRMSSRSCLNYWSEITAIPKERFVVRVNDGGTRCRTEFGMCRITILKGQSTLKLLSAIRYIFFNELIGKM